MSSEKKDDLHTVNSFLSSKILDNFNKINSLERITGAGFLSNSLTRQLDNVYKSNAFHSILDEINLTTSVLSKSLSAFDNIDFSRIERNNQLLVSKLIGRHQNLIGNLGFNSIQQLSKIADSIPKSSLELFSKSLLKSIPEIDLKNINHGIDRNLVEQDLQEIDLEGDLYDQLVNYFDEKINSLPKGTISAQGIKSKIDRILSVIIVILAFATYQNSRKTSEQNELMIQEQEQTNEHLGFLENFTEKIYPKIETLLDTDNDENLIIVKKESTLRVKPTAKSDSMTNVFPNQLLNIIEDQSRWYYVEFFDQRDSIPQMGWIYKGNVANYLKTE